MNKLLFGILLISASQAQSQNRVLIVGDSWAQLQVSNGSHAQVFSDNGYAHIRIDPASQMTTEDGTEAADWVRPERLQIIANIIQSNEDIDTVQLTLGGNDFLNAWNINMSTDEEQALQQRILSDLNVIVDFILLQNNDLEILLSFYDYPNFVDTTNGFTGSFCRNLHQEMGQPSVTALNTAAQVFEQNYTQLANNPRIHHVSHFGLMQTFFGFEDENIAPGDIMPPGDITRPSPLESMRDFGFGIRDCFHLTPQGYELIVQNAFDDYYKTRFDVIFKSNFESL